MKSLLNVALVLSLLVFVLGCGDLLSESDEPSSSNSETTETDDSGLSDQQDSFETDGDDDDESALEEDEKKQIGSKNVRVRFRKGRTNRAYKDKVGLGSTHTYTLGASKGQRMTVRISSTDKNAFFQVLDPIGKRISDSEVGNTNFVSELPVTGNYKIRVTSVRSTADYTVNFVVTALKKDDGDEVDRPGRRRCDAHS